MFGRRVNVIDSLELFMKQSTTGTDKVLLAIEKYYLELETDEHARYLSWEHCYKVFQKARNKDSLTAEDVDYLSLHLAFYLASWGMLRGSSFLLQKDYKVHLDIVKELYKSKYNNLCNIKYSEFGNSESVNLLMELIEEMKDIYREKRKNVKEVRTDISEILITKVLLGTMGCLPAYDEYFKKGVREFNLTQTFGKTSIKGLVEYYAQNERELEEIRRKISAARGIEYPQMKMLDIAFWQLGFQ